MILCRSVVAVSVGLMVTLSAPGQEAVDQGAAVIRPWSGYWWPFSEGGLTGPLAKYDQLTRCRAVDWEKENGRADPNAPRWHGYCHAQAAAAIMEREPQQAGRISWNGRSLEISVGDQKGWLAACHTMDLVEVHGDRFGDGDPEEELSDLRPEHLWHILQLYIRERGVPVVLDVEPDREVWNYPVFEYSIRYRPTDTPGLFRATLTLWMADIAVPSGYIGTQILKHTYTFTFRMRENAVVVGSGRWTGLSRDDHPDFAWYPYAAVAENPEVNYELIQSLLAQVEPREDVSPEEESQPSQTPPDSSSERQTPQVSQPAREEGTSISSEAESSEPCGGGVSRPYPAPQRTTPGPTTDESTLEPRPPSPSEKPSPVRPAGAEPATISQRTLLSPQELLSILVCETSCFKFDVSVDRFDGGRYFPGETYQVLGSSAQPGYLYLFLIDPNGELTLLYPMPGQDNRIAGQIQVPKSEDRFAFLVPETPGLYRIRALVTSEPIAIAGMWPKRGKVRHEPPVGFLAPSVPAELVKGEAPRWHPASRKIARMLLDSPEPPRGIVAEVLQEMDPRTILGCFAQDEIAFYVESRREEHRSE